MTLTETTTTHALTETRYGGPAGRATLPDADLNEVIVTQLNHRSVRAFLPDPVPEEVLGTVIAAAQSASTSSNLQPWSVVVVRDPDRKARLAELSGQQAHIDQAPVFLVFVVDFARIAGLASARGQGLEGAEYTDAALVGFIDAGIAAQNATLAAESLGLGAVYAGAVRNRPEQLADELGLPPLTFAAFGLSLGWPDPDQPATVKPRLPQTAVVHDERYDAERAAPVDLYEQRIGHFYAGQGLEHSWIERVIARLSGASALHGRAQIRRSLAARGLHLR